jgi:hypothetical protein
MVFQKKEVDPEIAKWGFCDTCACFVMSPGASRDMNGKCHLGPTIVPISLASMSWCSNYRKGTQRNARSTSANPTGITDEVVTVAEVKEEQ